MLKVNPQESGVAANRVRLMCLGLCNHDMYDPTPQGGYKGKDYSGSGEPGEGPLSM